MRLCHNLCRLESNLGRAFAWRSAGDVGSAGVPDVEWFGVIRSCERSYTASPLGRHLLARTHVVVLSAGVNPWSPYGINSSE